MCAAKFNGLTEKGKKCERVSVSLWKFAGDPEEQQSLAKHLTMLHRVLNPEDDPLIKG